MLVISALRATALTFACLGFQPALAAPPSAEVFFRTPDIGSAVLSPSGKKLAITSNKGLGRAALAVMDVAPGGQFKRISQFVDGDIYGVQWVNDDRLIFKVQSAPEVSTWHRAPPALYAIDSDGSKERRIGSGYYQILRIPSPVPGQANDAILVAHGTPAGDDELLPAWVNTRKHVWREPDLPGAPRNTVEWFADSRGELRAVITRVSNRVAAHWRAPGGDQWKQLFESDLLKQPFYIVGVDDAGTLYVTHRSGPERYRWLSRYDFKTGKPEDKFIAKTPGFDFDGSLVMQQGQVLGIRLTVDGDATHWFNPQMAAFQQRVDGMFPGRINHVDCSRCGEADMVAIVHSYSDQSPGALYLHQSRPAPGQKEWQAVGVVMEGIKAEQMASLSLHRTEARDGRDLPVWVTRPDNAKGPLPAVVLVHDGPWDRGRHWAWHAMPQFLASLGYVVIEPEMRGSTGYGSAHFEAGFKQWGQAMQHDVADALHWAQAQGLASGRSCIAGDGYGGYSTLVGLANDPELFRCGIASFAFTDLDLLVSGSWWTPDSIHSVARAYTLPQLVGDAKLDAAMLAAQSPIRVADRIKAPVMLIYGEKDWRVPLAHGERMRAALRKAGNDPTWVTYADEGHGLRRLQNRTDRAERIAAFLAKHLGPASP